MTARRIKVLVVDDSALVRQTLADIVSGDEELELIGTASDPFVAAKRMENVAPDVILLDVEMPRMDGITFLRKIMTQHPIPVVICSSVTEQGAEATFKAMEYGAVEVIQKPRMGTKRFLEESSIRICDALKAAARSRLRKLSPLAAGVPPKLSADAVLPAATPLTTTVQQTEKMVVIGASTGGTEALRVVLEALPEGCPPIAIVQHMPEHFTAAFANRLNAICRVTVKEAQDNDVMRRGQVRRAQRRGRHHDRHGRRRRGGHEGTVRRGRAHHRPGRGQLRGFRHAAGSHQAGWGAQGGFAGRNSPGHHPRLRGLVARRNAPVPAACPCRDSTGPGKRVPHGCGAPQVAPQPF